MPNFILKPNQKKYLHTALNRVARTFALLPPFLDSVLADIMSTAYLVCRVVDSVEDCHQPFAWKQKRFDEVKLLLRDPSSAEAILSVWSQLEWPGLNDDEIAFMKIEEGLELWKIFENMPQPYRNIICHWATEMAIGMEGTLNPAASPHVVRDGNVAILRGLEDYNRYCYYVAGTVGYLQTEMLNAFYDFSDDVFKVLQKYSLAFGLGLQKTNIVKDFLDDLNRGICYIPSTWLDEIQNMPLLAQGATPDWIKQVLVDVKSVLDEAVEYISILPYKVNGVRQATLMCLLPAYQTILLAAKESRLLFTKDHQIKISKLVLAGCFRDAKRLAGNNQLLLQYRENVHMRFYQSLAMES